MAYTHIHKITGTVGKALAYIMSDKIEACVPASDIADSISYVVDDKTGNVVYKTLTTMLNCNPAEPGKTFDNLINRYGRYEVKRGNSRTKDGKPVLAWHLYQSFEGYVDPIIANEIGRKLAEEILGDYAVVISTHTNTENTHNHIEFCAWNLSGGKYNCNHASYDKIRETSDRLCDEYGLSVIEHTRKRKLVRYTDKEGNIRYYESTARKEKLREQRKAGEISTDDVNSYRNSIAYEVSENRALTKRAIVKADIDNLLPVAISYEHLLQLLRECGYTIKDKKKNGEWRDYITFQSPTADKGIRDDSLSDDGYYLREKLTKIIREREQEREEKETPKQAEKKQTSVSNTIPYFASYEYGETDLDSINEDYRAERDAGGRLHIVNRGECEKKVIRDVKKCDRVLCDQFDTTVLRRMIAQQKEVRKKKAVPSKEREIQLIHRIQDGLENLRFMERNHISDYPQIINMTKSIWGQYNQCAKSVMQSEENILYLERLAGTPERLETIQTRINRMKNDLGYVTNEVEEDIRQLRCERKLMDKYHLYDAGRVQELQNKVTRLKAKKDDLISVMDRFKDLLEGYDHCVSMLSRIEGIEIDPFLRAYREVKCNGEQEANKLRDQRIRNVPAIKLVKGITESDWNAQFDEVVIPRENAYFYGKTAKTRSERKKKERGGYGDE